jgi:hypothetical protein
MAAHSFRTTICKFLRDSIEILFWFHVFVGAAAFTVFDILQAWHVIHSVLR